MRVMTAFRRWLSPHQARPAAPPRRPPVVLDLHAADPDPDTDTDLDTFDPGDPASTRPPRSRHELVAELQRNYQEVLGLVRKVDSHLDRQSERSERLAVIAERFPRAADDLAQARVRQEHACEIMDTLAQSLSARDERLAASHSAQLDRLDEVRDLLAESAQNGRQLVGALVDFRDIMSALSGAADRLTDAVTHLEKRDTDRAAQLVAAITSARRWAIALSIIVGSCGLIAIAVASIR